MADNVATQSATLATVPAATNIATDQLASGEHVQKMKLLDATADSTNGLVITPAGLAKVDGSGVIQPVSGTVGINNFPAVQPVNDNAGSLTVDAPVGTPVWVRLSDGAAAFVGQKAMAASVPVVVASDQSALPVSGTFFQATQPVSGSGVFHVDDNAGSLTVDNPTISVVGGGTEATAQRVTIANDSTGVLSVDDNGGSLTVDGTVTANAGTGPFPVSDNAGSLTVDAPVGTPVFARLSDGAAVLIGQKVMASSLPVAIASDQSALDVSDRIARLVGQVDGRAATDAAVAGNPHQVGGRASYPTIAPTMSADGDAVPSWLDRSGATVVRKRPVAMYSSVYRLADATAAMRGLAFTFVANTDKQLATIYHAGTATKRVQIKYVSVTLVSVSVIAALEFEIQPLSATTAPATGNPAITPGKHDPADAAAEATCLSLPTTAGSLVGVNSPVGESWINNEGVTANPTLTGGSIANRCVLWDSRADGDGKDLIMRAATAEGYAVIGRANAAPATVFMVTIIFTEE